MVGFILIFKVFYLCMRSTIIKWYFYERDYNFLSCFLLKKRKIILRSDSSVFMIFLLNRRMRWGERLWEDVVQEICLCWFFLCLFFLVFCVFFNFSILDEVLLHTIMCTLLNWLMIKNSVEMVFFSFFFLCWGYKKRIMLHGHGYVLGST